MYYHEELLFPSDGKSNYRIPSLIITRDGAVLAFCNDRKNTVRDHAVDTALVYAKKAPGKGWTKPITLLEHPGICCLIGSAVYDGETNTSIVFVKRKIARDEFGDFSDEEMEKLEAEDARLAGERGIELGSFQFESRDSGETWTLKKLCEEPLLFRHINGKEVLATLHTHGGAHGIQLRHGKYRGRLLCPSRFFTGRYTTWEEISNFVYNNAVYSDDHGKTWKVSSPVQLGTGEGTLIELENGEILYNSRAYFRDGKRYLAKSTDGGATFADQGSDPFLREEKRIGCNASFLRVERKDLGDEIAGKYLPAEADSLTVFINPRADTRCNLTACISFDSGKTWREARCICPGPAAYSGLDFSPVDRHFHLIYEKGEVKPCDLGIAAAEFDVEWLLS